MTERQILAMKAPTDEERRALAPSYPPSYGQGLRPRAGAIFGEFDGDAQARSLATHLATLEGLGRAEVSFAGLPRNDRDRLPPREVVTEDFFPPPYPGKPGPDASVDEIKAWNAKTRDADPEDLLRMMSISPWTLVNTIDRENLTPSTLNG